MLKLLFDWAGKMSQASRVTTGSGKQAQKAARGARGCPTSGAGPGLTPTEGSLSATHRPLATQGGDSKAPPRAPDINNSRISSVIKKQIIAQGGFKCLRDPPFALRSHSYALAPVRTAAEAFSRAFQTRPAPCPTLPEGLLLLFFPQNDAGIRPPLRVR